MCTMVGMAGLPADRYSVTLALHRYPRRDFVDYTRTYGRWWSFSRTWPRKCMTWVLED